MSIKHLSPTDAKIVKAAAQQVLQTLATTEIDRDELLSNFKITEDADLTTVTFHVGTIQISVTSIVGL